MAAARRGRRPPGYRAWNPFVAVLFYERWLHTDTLPMFRAMNAALADQVTGG